MSTVSAVQNFNIFLLLFFFIIIYSLFFIIVIFIYLLYYFELILDTVSAGADSPKQKNYS
jgi:hypothetical protein